jgi:hypothetical protein
MEFKKETIDRVIELINVVYPAWEGCGDLRFVEGEIGYKKSAIEKFKNTLSQKEYKKLISNESFDEILSRIKSLGQKTNLL